MADHSKEFKNTAKGGEDSRGRRRTDRVELRKKEREDQAMKRRNVGQGKTTTVPFINPASSCITAVLEEAVGADKSPEAAVYLQSSPALC